MVWSRSCLAVSWACAGTAVAGVAPRSSDEAALLARSLEGMANRGEISGADLDRLRGRVYGRWPEARGASPPPVFCGNQAVRDARAFAREAGEPLLRFPPPYSDFLSSSAYPIRVHHDGDPTVAQVVPAPRSSPSTSTRDSVRETSRSCATS
jgi:hypothetical protein